MSRHVDRFLTAYTEGQLNANQATWVRYHLAECDLCRSKLANRERFVSDLRLALAHSSIPRQRQIEQWWALIVISPHERHPEPRWWLPSAVVPMILTMLLLVLPVTVGLNRAHGNAAGLGITATSPDVNATNMAPTEGARTQQPLRWAARLTDSTHVPFGDQPPPSPVTPAPVVPAPAAP